MTAPLSLISAPKCQHCLLLSKKPVDHITAALYFSLSAFSEAALRPLSEVEKHWERERDIYLTAALAAKDPTVQSLLALQLQAIPKPPSAEERAPNPIPHDLIAVFAYFLFLHGVVASLPKRMPSEGAPPQYIPLTYQGHLLPLFDFTLKGGGLAFPTSAAEMHALFENTVQLPPK